FFIFYANAGPVRGAEPWLIGVEGVLSASEVEFHLYGTRPILGCPPKISESPSGSVIARPDDGVFRSGRQRHLDAEQLERSGHPVFTLVDTLTHQIYYFSATRPPTVCVFIGREGGMGRYILCSEYCTSNELHKETVLRMPTYLSG